MERKDGTQNVSLQQFHNIPIKSRRLLKALKESQSCFKFYNWDIVENYSYITYLTNFRYIFDSQAERKRIKVFRHLSKLIKTRNPHQIKSHHQKMMLRHKTVDQIIEFLRIKITRELSLQPRYIQVIEKINKEAQEFFRSQLAIHNAQQCESIGNNLESRNQDISLSKMDQKLKVKVEEGPTQYFCGQPKRQQTPQPSQTACLKQQQEHDMILRIN